MIKFRLIYLIFLLVSLKLFSQSENNFNEQNINKVTKNETNDTVKLNLKPSITISKIANLQISLDGVLNEPQWQTAQTAGGFVEIDPGDNLTASVNTEVKFLYDEQNIYIAFICYDNNISSLRANLTDRDKFFSDDFVGVIIDTYKDNKQAYEIFINPYGIQGDGIWTNQGEDFSFDMVFDSDAKIYKDKWIAEISIPFTSLRFPAKPQQQWNLHIIRNHPRQQRKQYSWAKISRDNPEFLMQAGTLNGLNNLSKSKQIELLPYFKAYQFGFRKQPRNPESEFVNEKIKVDFGIGFKYGFSSYLTGELTVNPDFSQIESDAQTININSPSAVFYPEKRPFFLDGSNIFKSYINILYTRMINSPIFAAKIIGKVNDIDLGFISAYDSKTPFIVPNSYGSYFIQTELKSFAAALRLKKSLKGSSYIGFIGTLRQTGSSYNRVLSIDGSYSFNDKFYLSGQLAGYFTRELNKPELYSNNNAINKNGNDAGFNGEYLFGLGGNLNFSRITRYWNTELFFNFLPPEARRELGYIGNNDYKTLGLSNTFYIYPKNSFVIKIIPNLDAGLKYDYNNYIKEQWLIPNIFIQFDNQINLSAGVLAVNNERYYSIYHKNINRAWFNININTYKKLTGGIFFEAGKFIVRFENPSYIGWGWNSEAWLSFKPISNLVLENTYNYYELSENFKGKKLYTGYIFRNKSTFQFSKNLFLRIIFQYNSFSKSFDIDPLFSYKWNPFTIFYIGSAHNIAELPPSPNSPKLLETKRQFFAKFQYLFEI